MINPVSNNKNLSDKYLLFLCQKYGTQCKLWRQKFLGLLPEVNKRNLYRQKGFNSIFEFAARLAGVSEKQVCLVLGMERKFADKPKLQNLLINGQVSVNKLARIVSIATPENQGILADQVQLLPQKALEVFVKDEKIAIQSAALNFANFDTSQNCNLNSSTILANQIANRTTFTQNLQENGLFKAENSLEFLRTQKSQLQLSSETTSELLELQNKGINIDELIQKMLNQRKVEIATSKEQLSTDATPTKSRYIPKKIKAILRQEYGEKCSIKTCLKPSKEIHHSQRFALSQTHDAKYMAPFCHEHHIIAQTIDVKYHQIRKTVTSSKFI